MQQSNRFSVFNLSAEQDKGKVRLFQDPAKKEERNAKKVDQCIEVVKRRIDETGTKEPSVYKQGKDRIIVQLAGVQNPEEVKKLLGQTGRLTFKLVKETIPTTSKPYGLPHLRCCSSQRRSSTFVRA